MYVPRAELSQIVEDCQTRRRTVPEAAVGLATDNKWTFDQEQDSQNSLLQFECKITTAFYLPHGPCLAVAVDRQG